MTGRPWSDQTFASCDWSPDGKILWVENDNIFYAKQEDILSTNNSISLKEIHKLTDDGENVKNGVSDWVYEEEILESSKAYYWSSDGRYLTFIQFNDSEVNIVPIINYKYDKKFPTAEELITKIPYPRYEFFLMHEKSIKDQVLKVFALIFYKFI